MTDNGKPDTNPLTEGFREPPDHVTDPCLTYMARITELRQFVSFYFGFVKTSQFLGQSLTDDMRESIGDDGTAILKYNYSNQRPFMNQIMLSRAIESFDLYLTTLLRDIFLSRPEMLKSEGTIDVATIIDTGNYEDLIWQIVERKVHELSYKPLGKLRKFVISRTGIELFPSEEVFEMTIVASEIRNLIAHNDCKANDLFRSRIKDIVFPLDISDSGRIEIEDIWLRRTSYMLDGIVFNFDELAAKKFNLDMRLRMGAFTLRT